MKERIYRTQFFEVTVHQCSNPQYWYVDMVGQKVMVREVNWQSAFVEAKNGFSCLRSDLRVSNEQFRKASPKRKEILKFYLPAIHISECSGYKNCGNGVYRKDKNYYFLR